MNEQELNQKLAEWAGLEILINDTPLICREPDSSVSFLGNFTQSLDACFKWLVPPAIDKIMAEQGHSSDIAYAILFKKWLQELELMIPNAALAFCLAVEKLIDRDA